MNKLSDAIPNRLRALRLDRKWTLAEMAERVGTSPTQIMRIEQSSRKLTVEWMERFAAALDIDAAELAGGRANVAATRSIPIIGTIAAGNWQEAVQHAEGRVDVPVDWAGGENTFALRAVGDSMNLVVPEGGWVVVDPDDPELHEGRIYAIMNDQGETTVKRYRVSPSRLEPCSTNPDHQPIALGRTQFSVVGRVKGMFVQL